MTTIALPLANLTALSAVLQMQFQSLVADFPLKAKWSWTENASHLHKADSKTVNVNASIADSIHLQRLNAKVWVLEYSRTPECFEKDLLGCADLASCREVLGERVKHKSGAKIFVTPELYAATVYEMERDGEKFQSRHVVASGEFLDVVRTVITRDIAKKHKIKEKCCDELKILPPVIEQNGFLMFSGPPRSLMSSGTMQPKALSVP